MSINFVVWAPGYTPNSGGIVALNKLVHTLSSLGENTYLFAPSKNQAWGGSLITQQEYDALDKNRTVVVYPEIIIGNPLNTKHVVRWLLNTPGAVGGDGIYQESDLIFKYTDYFKAPDESKCLGLLTAYDMRLEKFYDMDRLRIGECYTIRKGGYKKLDKHSPTACCIEHTNCSDEGLNTTFNLHERFISYDHATFLSVQAALSGCISIVIPDDNMDKEEWKRKLPCCKYGVAYGLDDIEWAKSTMHLVRDNLIALENESIEQTKRFVEICKNVVG